MSNVAMFIAFRLKNEVSTPDFLLASDQIQADYLSKCKGYLSRTLFVSDGVWNDLVIWETMEDAEQAMVGSEKTASAAAFFSCIAEVTQQTLAPIERSY